MSSYCREIVILRHTLTPSIRLSPDARLSKQIKLGPTDTLKLLLTTTEDKTAKRPHQAFLTLHEPKTGLEESFVFTVKESGKARVELVCHDFLTIQFLADG